MVTTIVTNFIQIHSVPTFTLELIISKIYRYFNISYLNYKLPFENEDEDEEEAIHGCHKGMLNLGDCGGSIDRRCRVSNDVRARRNK